jgi:ferredoxin
MQSRAVDWTRCDGHGLCRALLPDRIELDEWGFPMLRDTHVAPGDATDVRRAVAACPALALSISGSAAPRTTAATR